MKKVLLFLIRLLLLMILNKRDNVDQMQDLKHIMSNEMLPLDLFLVA